MYPLLTFLHPSHKILDCADSYGDDFRCTIGMHAKKKILTVDTLEAKCSLVMWKN